MPDTEEDVIRELMFRSTEDLFASPAATAQALRRQRQHRARARVLGVTGIAAAAGLAVGDDTIVSGSGAHPATGPGGPAPVHATAQLTDARRRCTGWRRRRRGDAAPGRPVRGPRRETTDIEPGGEGERDRAEDKRHRHGHRRRRHLSGHHGLRRNRRPVPQGAGQPGRGPRRRREQLDAMPTNPAELRAFLLAQAKQQLAQAYAEAQGQAKNKGKKIGGPSEPDRPMTTWYSNRPLICSGSRT